MKLTITKQEFQKWREDYGDGGALCILILAYVFWVVLQALALAVVAGLMSLVYNALAAAFSLPIIHFWIWCCVILIMRFIRQYLIRA